MEVKEEATLNRLNEIYQKVEKVRSYLNQENKYEMNKRDAEQYLYSVLGDIESCKSMIQRIK